MNEELGRERELGEIQAQLKGIWSVLREIKEQFARLNGSVAELKAFRDATEPVVDSMIERLNIVSDKTDAHQTYIDQQQGGTLARVRMFAELTTAIGVLVLLAKLFLFHN